MHTGFFLAEKPEGKRRLGRPRPKLGDNVKMDLQVVGLGDIDWTNLAQDTNSWRELVNAEMKLRVPYNAGIILTS